MPFNIVETLLHSYYNLISLHSQDLFMCIIWILCTHLRNKNSWTFYCFLSCTCTFIYTYISYYSSPVISFRRTSILCDAIWSQVFFISSQYCKNLSLFSIYILQFLLHTFICYNIRWTLQYVFIWSYLYLVALFIDEAYWVYVSFIICS